MSQLVELALVCPQQRVEWVGDALMELEALAVSVEDADAETEDEQALFGEPGLPAPQAGWQRSTLKALFDSEEAATAAATLLSAQDWTRDVQLIALQSVPDEDWVRLPADPEDVRLRARMLTRRTGVPLPRPGAWPPDGGEGVIR